MLSTLSQTQERLTVHNAELCDRLAATQHSRTILEREVLSLKRKLLEEKTVNGRLDQLLRSSDRERTAMKEQMKQLVSAERSNADIEALAKEKVFHSDNKFRWTKVCLATSYPYNYRNFSRIKFLPCDKHHHRLHVTINKGHKICQIKFCP